MIRPRSFTGSIVARMTAWYAGSALVLILAATGFLYWVLATSFDAEDRHTLANTVTDLALPLRASGELRLPEAATPAPSHSLRQPQEIWVRIVNAEGRTLLNSSGMDAELPVTVFPQVAEVEVGHDINGEIATASGRLFQILSARALAYSGHPDGRVLQVAMDRSTEELLLVHYRERLWFVVVVSVILCSAVGYAIARRGIRPIERVTTTARRVLSSTLHERIDTRDLPTELRALAATFNEMLDRLEESFAQVSQFSADVAHELRTPISNLRGELEVALGKTRPADEYRAVLGSALEECVRISRVIQSLLFLARAETATGDDHHDSIRVRQEIGAVLDFYEVAAAEADLVLHVEGMADFVASFDRTFFQQAVGNLVANAIAHTPPGGRVTMHLGSDDAMLRIEVADTGCGIAPEHLPHVFDRFYRSDRARTGSSGNLGLGLAMVRSIATLHGGRVAISSQVGQGTRVTLEVPLTGTAPQPKGTRQLA